MDSKYNEFTLDHNIKNYTDDLYLKIKDFDITGKTNITILEKDMLDNFVSMYINLLNKIRCDNLDRALQIKMPILSKDKLSFKNNYDSYYKYLYLLFENSKDNNYYNMYIEIAIIIDKFNSFL